MVEESLQKTALSDNKLSFSLWLAVSVHVPAYEMQCEANQIDGCQTVPQPLPIRPVRKFPKE